MSRRCWPGCLALCVRSDAGNEGRIVEVLHFAGRISERVKADNFWLVRPIDGKPVKWITDEGRADYIGDYLHDNQLIPITPPPGTVIEDEALERYAPRHTEAV